MKLVINQVKWQSFFKKITKFLKTGSVYISVYKKALAMNWKDFKQKEKFFSNQWKR